MTTEKKTAEQIYFNKLKQYPLATNKTIALLVAKEFARQSCAEQREICAESAKINFDPDLVDRYQAELITVDKDSICNAKEPEL